MKIKNKLTLCFGAIVTTSLFFSVGCSPFNNKNNQKVNTENVVVKNVINIEENSVSKDDIKNANKILNDIYKNLDKKEAKKYYSAKNDDEIKEINNKVISKINSMRKDFKSKMINDVDNPFSKIFKNTLKEEGDNVWSMSLVGIGYESKSEPQKIILADINFVSDNPGFRIQPIKMTLDKSNNIVNIEQEGDILSQGNTRTPLTEKSELNGDLNVNFKTSLNTLLKKLDNKAVYENLKENPKKINDVENLISSINIKDVSKDELIDLFNSYNGCEKGHYGITEYVHSDFNANGESKYVLSIPIKNKIKNYNITYNRITDKITGIK